MTFQFYLLSFVSVLTIIVFTLFITLILIYVTTNPYPYISRSKLEEQFYDPRLKKFKNFPKIKDVPSIDLSIIIPAYNEEKRLIPMLEVAIDYLEKKQFKYEIIVVDDGSRDKTTEVALKYTEKYSADIVRVLTLEKNRGKGGAVRLGMLSSRGKELLFADADGSTTFSEIEKLRQDLRVQLLNSDVNMALVCGSRAHLTSNRLLCSTLLMKVFHFWVSMLCKTDIRDTQCGFKLFSRSAARLLFCNMHVERWAFDVDLLYLAAYFRVSLSEVYVNWTEIEGSKVVPVFSWLQMAKDVMLVKLRYALGAWKIEPWHKLE